MNKFFKYSYIAVTTFFGACTLEMPVEIEEGATDENMCRMIFESPKPCFEGTSRSNDEEWENGDCIYLKFVKADETIVTGKAVYDATDEIWNLEYKGSLSSIENAKCVVCYFEDGGTEDATYVNFSATTGIYLGVGQYTRSVNELKVKVTLLPYQSRIRFTGKAGTKFQISGPLAYISFNKDEFKFYYESATESSINSNGSSPYLYLTLRDTDREVSISYDNLSFIMTCKSPMLDDGISGYMDLPTRESHNGWEMIETAAPTIGETFVSNVEANSADFSSSIISDGNASITDCGFVYSLSQNATLDNMSIKCSVFSFNATVTGLTLNTTYYVRAYATNSVGTAYGEEVSFTTKYGDIVLVTESAKDVTHKSALIPCKITSLGGHSVTECGVCWGTAQNPTTANNIVKAATAANNYEIALTNLAVETQYYVRAYAKAEDGTVFYGNGIDFTTNGKDVAIDKDGYGEDENWNSCDNGAFNKNGYGKEDDNWNK